MDKDLFIKAWDKKELNLKKSEEFWDLRAEEFNQSTETEPLIEMFIKEGVIDSNSEVLDLGCGPGKYSLEFASIARNVTAVDISSNMLNCAKKNAEQKGLKNIDFYKASWQETDLNKFKWHKKFDLSFASMTPGIINPEDFFKLLDSSKGYCYVSGFLEREDKLKDRLEEYLGIKKPRENDTKIYYMFNILWNMGIYPNIKYIDRTWDKVLPIQKAYAYFCGQFEQDGSLTEEICENVSEFLEKEAVNGVIKETIKSKIAQIYWKVN